MGVLYDAGSEYHRSASAAVVTLTHTATIANVQGVVVAFIRGGTTAPTISNVSYGGVSLVRVANAADTATEPGNSELWSTTAPVSLLSGVRTVIYSTGAPASNVHVTIMTFTGRHPAYAIGSGTKSQNTTSWSVSLTTGYVSGYGIGAFYGGGAEPATLTYGTDRTLVHDWDMGAFYGEVFRTTNPTTAGDGPVLGFGGHFTTAVSDDVAFSALFLTDGSIDAARGQVAMQGLAPTVLGEAVVAAPVGLVATGTLAPRIEGDVGAGLGAGIAGGLAPTLLSELPVFPGVGQVTLIGLLGGVEEIPRFHVPTLWTELRQDIGLGGAATVGQAPSESMALTQAVGLGLIAAGGQVPGESRELVQGVGLGLGAIGGHSPNCLGDGAIGPVCGAAIAGGLAPSLLLERVIQPDVGSNSAEGRDPTCTGDGEQPVEGSCSPDAGGLQVIGHAPTIAVASDVRGHVKVKRRRHRRNYGELEQLVAKPAPAPSPVPAAALAPPEVVETPREPIAALATGETEARIRTLETRRSRLARMRREEEELIAILMRAA